MSVEQQLQTQDLMQALWTIAQESRDVESVRSAIAALTNSEAGINYLAINPLKS